MISSTLRAFFHKILFRQIHLFQKCLESRVESFEAVVKTRFLAYTRFPDYFASRKPLFLATSCGESFVTQKLRARIELAFTILPTCIRHDLSGASKDVCPPVARPQPSRSHRPNDRHRAFLRRTSRSDRKPDPRIRRRSEHRRARGPACDRKVECRCKRVLRPCYKT